VLGSLLLCCCSAALRHGLKGLAFVPPSSGLQLPSRDAGRREAMLLLSSAGVAAGAAPAGAIQGQATGKTENIVVRPNPKVGSPGYIFEKPAGFKRLASPVDPSGYIFRNVNDTYFSFVTRVEQRPNASTDFKPEAFIEDYRSKFLNSSGSDFKLIRGGGNPDLVDKDLGVKYYEVEYVVRTQLGFSFDSLKSLHFITTFAVNQDTVAIMNCQAPDEFWEKDGPKLRRITDTFRITS